ncbi:MAG TPA: putative dsRNA-binding protein, partial [Bacteroidia bacterium]|nr:putative dsRNA-binding protein [Bacteroidia bacterium]
SDKIVANETNFKSRVIEWCQKNKIEFEFITDESEKNQRSFFSVTLLVGGNEKGKGEAFSKKKAEQHAAQQFYEAIKEEL